MQQHEEHYNHYLDLGVHAPDLVGSEYDLFEKLHAEHRNKG